MKKIYLFLTFLLSWLGGAGFSAFAQSSNAYEIDESSPLIEDVSQLSSPYTETSEGSLEALLGKQSESAHPNDAFWHSAWSNGAVEPGTHYFQVEMPDGEYNLIAFVYGRRPNANNQTIRWSVRGTNEFDAAKADCELLAEVSTPFNSNNQSEVHTSTPFDPKGYTYLRFYSEETNGQGGEQKGFFHVGTFQLYPVVMLEEYEAALRDLFDAIDKYGAYTEEDFPFGTDPGQYSEAAFQALQEAIVAANAAEGATELTAEDLLEFRDAIIAAYEALVASKVPVTLADGYYRIRGGMKYTNNVVIGKDDDGNDITEEMLVDKYLYSTVEGEKIVARWQTPRDLTADATCLWRITNKDGAFDIINADTEARFNNVAQSTAVEMSVENENLMALDPVITTDGITYVNIRVSTQAAGGYLYLHQNGHGGGVNVSGNIVGWCTTYDKTAGEPKASEWVFDPVSDEEAALIIEAYQPIKNHDLLVEQYQEMLSDAKSKLETAEDIQVVNLITKNSQFSSPWTDPGEGSLNNLIDGDAGTFWHSSWHESPPHSVQGSHYLQVEMPDGYYSDGLQIRLRFTRRNVNNDHTTLWSIRGTNDELETDLNDPMIDKEECEVLFEPATPLGATNETLTTDPFDPKGYKYLRFYSEEEKPSNRVYWHVAEFQLFYQKENPTPQIAALADVADALKAVIEAQADIEMDNLTIDEYNELKAAYEAFVARFVDPAPLRDAIAVAETKLGTVAQGTQPGYWSDLSTATALQATVDAATAYDAAGAYTAEQSQNYIETIEAQEDAIDKAVIGIQTGKWYRIRFGTEEEFTAGEWDMVAGNGTTTTESLWGKYVTVAEFEQPTGEPEVHWSPDPTTEPVMMGHKLYFDDAEDIEEPTYAQFRFIAVGDTAYALQNRATGLFVRAAGTSGAVSLNAGLSLFNVRAIGYGQNVIGAKALSGERQSNLHAQVGQNVLVTWDVDYPGSRSGLYIEEVEDVAPDYDGTAFLVPLEPGSVSTFCFPEEVSTEEANLYDISKLEDTGLTLVPIQGAVNAGRPFVCIYGNTEDYNSESEEDLSEPVAFKHGYDFVQEPVPTNILKGTFTSLKVGIGVIVAEGNKFVVTKTSDRVAGANTAYISDEEPYATSTELSFVIDGEGEDGIAAALDNVARGGELYTIDGRLVSRKANLNDLGRYGKGIYILNGTKVTVK